ncbi:MAG: hypothetical protein M1608_09390 [Candidatus Omnitrophica bacterium]|nr:hypothetical protein [Candidatus Omnitrophota bacterium]
MRIRSNLPILASTLIAILTPLSVLSGAELPAVSSGVLQLWLKADAGVIADANSQVSEWDDQSENANNAVQSDPLKQPVLVPGAVVKSGKPVLRFDGVQSTANGDYLQGTGLVDIPAGYTSFLVYLRANPSPVSEQIPLGVGVPGQVNANRLDYIRSGFGGGNSEMSFAAWANDHGTGFSIPVNTYRIWTTRLSDDMTLVDLHDSDGVTDSAFSIAVGNLLAPQAGYYVGGLGAQTRNMQGDIAEVIIYQGALSDEDVTAVEDYLKAKYYRPEIAPYVISFSPQGNAVRTNAVISMEIQDNVSQLAPASVQLFLNGTAVAPVITKPPGASVSTVTYDPKGALNQEATNTVTIIFADNSTPPIVQTNEFSFGVISDQKAANIINLDFNGFRNTPGLNTAGATYAGAGVAGGGDTFNGLMADSTMPDGSDNDSITVTGANFLNSIGQPTTVTFSISAVGGRNDGVSPTQTGSDALLNDYIFVGNYGQTSGTADFTIGGLGSVPSVDLYFYRGPGSPAQPVTIPGATPDVLVPSGDFTAANTVYFSHVPVSAGKITGTLSGANASMAGLTIMKPLPQPYVQSIAPTGRGVSATLPVTIELFDYVTTVAANTIQLSLNDQLVTPAIDKPAGSAVTTITYLPTGGWTSQSTNTVKIIFSDTSTPAIVQSTEYTFVVEKISAQPTWDVSADFSLAGNPNGAWSYGSMARLDGLPDVTSFNLYTDGTSGDLGTPIEWWHTGAIDPNVSHNPTAADFSAFEITWSPGEISLGPGFGGTLTAARWTAPEDGLYSINTAFTDNQGGGAVGADVYVYLNDTQVFVGDSGTAVGAGVSLATNLTLTAGDHLDFIVGAGSDLAPTGKNTRLDATLILRPPAPYVIATSPEGRTVRANATISVQIVDHITQLDPASVQLFLNGAAVTPTIAKPAGSDVSTITYDPKGALIQEATNTVQIVFGDNGSPALVQTNEFSFWVISELKAANIINIDFNGVRNTPGLNDVGATYAGQGAAGGGAVFNGLTADSMLPDGSDNDSLTVGGTNLLDSIGQPTTVSFTISPVGGRNDGATPDGTGPTVLFSDYIFVGNFGQTSGSADFTIGGLGSIPSADLYFYLGPGSPAQPVQIAGASPTAFPGAGSFTSANTVFFSHVPITGGSISCTLTGANACLSGLSIAKPLPLPYVQSTSPAGKGVKSTEPINIQLYDYGTVVVLDSIQLTVNGQAVSPTVNKPAGSPVTTITYLPTGGWPSLSTNNVKIVFGDNATPPNVQSAEFTFVSERTSAQPFWSVADNYSLAGNPNGTWSYGSMSRVGGLPDTSTLTLYTDGTAGGLGTPIEFWHTGGWDPNVSHNPTDSDYLNFGVHWYAGIVSLGPGFDGTLTAARWTAPSAGTYTINAMFTDDQDGGDGADVYVYHNDTALFRGNSGTTVGSGTNFTTVLFLAAGDQLDFIGGAGADLAPTGDNAALDAVITLAWSAAGDYSIAANPNGAWSYGSFSRTNSLPDVASFTLYTDGTANGIGTPMDFWHTGGWDPNVSHNPTTSDYSNFGITWKPGTISLGPGFDGTLTGVRWTAPAAGSFVVSAAFTDDQDGGDGADVYLYHNGTALFKGNTGNVSGAGTNFTTIVSLAVGDHIDFIAGAGADLAPTGDNTALDAVIYEGAMPSVLQLSIALQANAVVLSWTGTATLQSADSLLGPWNNITDATSPYTVTPSGPGKFYRLKQ